MAGEKAAKSKEKKVKRPSALKRNLQSQKRRLANRSFKSSVLTAVRGFEVALSQKEEPSSLQKKLSEVYSLMDKGVKKGVYKRNKAARIKSRLSLRTTS